MENRKFLILLAAMVIAAWVPSCKKKSSSAASGNILIATVDKSQAGAIEHYRLVYDALNEVDSIISIGGGTDTGSNGYKYYTYYSTSYTITDQNNNSVSVSDSNGVIEEIDIPDTIILTYYNNLLGVYNIKTSSPNYPYYALSVADYSWANNGDITSISIQGGATETYNYNTAKTGQIGDGSRIDDFLNYGRPFFSTHDQPTELLSNGSWVEQYYYLYDNEGRISQLLKVESSNGTGPNDTVQYNYTYYY